MSRGDAVAAVPPAPSALGNLAWKLKIGKTYLVDVHVKGSNVECKATFKLEYLSGNFGEFRLQAVK
jgi:hypothetical protein